MNLKPFNYVIGDIETGSIFEHITVGDIWDSCLCAVVRALYYERASSDLPFRLGYPNAPELVENQVSVVAVSDWFQCDHLKKKGRLVPAAGALKKYGVECRAFVQEDIHAGLIAMKSRIDSRYFVGLLPQVSPWFFREKLLSDGEKQMLMSILNNDDVILNQKLREFIERINLETKLKVAQMDAFISNLLENKLQKHKEREEELLSLMSECEERMRSLMSEYTEVSSRIIGIRGSHNDDDISLFASSFVSNPNCQVESINGSKITFIATGLLSNFDKSAYEAISRTYGSSLYESCYLRTVQHDVFKAFLDEVTLGKRYRLNLAGKFTLDFASNTYALCRTSDNVLHENAMPNPHIAHYICAGGFAAMFNEAFRRGDYLEVLDIIFSEVQNINWSDSSPVGKFSNDIFKRYWKHPCVFDKVEKKFISPSDLVKILEVKQNGE